MSHFQITFPVRYYETDQMGVVHHSNYIRYFEVARNSMIRESGYPIEECEKDGVMIPIVSVSCKYHIPARMGDVLTVTADIEKVPLAKLVVIQKVFNQRGELCADGETVLGFIDSKTFRPVRCPERLKRIFEEGMKES